MKILTIVNELGGRGTAKAAIEFTFAYQNLGHDVAVLTFSCSGDREEELRRSKVHLFIGENKAELLTAAAHWGPEIVHLHRDGSFERFTVEALTILRKKEPSLICIETSVFGRVDYSSSHSIIDLHMHVSAFNLWRWRKWLGSRKQLGVLVANPINTFSFVRASTEDIALQRQEWGIPNDAYICLHMGYKASKFIFDGFKELYRVSPSSYLVFAPYDVGMDRYFYTLPSNIRKHVIRIREAQNEKKLARIISASDCLLHAAEIGETFGYVLAEAQMCGLPVVTLCRPHRDNAQVELVQHGANGLVAGNSSCFPKAVVELYKNQNLRNLVKKEGPNRIREMYASELMAQLSLRAVNHLRQHKSIEARALALSADPCLKCHIDDDVFLAAAKNTLGGINFIDYFFMRLVLNPLIQRVIRLVRHKELFIFGKKIF